MSEASYMSNPVLLVVSVGFSSLFTTGAMTVDSIKLLLTFLSGGAFGSVLTIIYHWIRGRIQVMECHYIDDDVISRLPMTNPDGEIHQNIFSKQFLLKNTTNTDHKEFKVIFQFDVAAKILRHTNTTKIGVDRQKIKLLKPNEYSITIRNFNRGDEVKFIFDIANITEDLINVTEDGCIGFKVKVKDKRKAREKSKITLVEKTRLNPPQPSLPSKISVPDVEPSNEKSEYALTKQIADDFHINDNLDFENFNYEITAIPSNSTNYWRFGIKFSNSSIIPDGRLTQGIPLVHLTKNLEHEWLGFTYYDEKNVLWSIKDKILIEKYSKTSIKLKISASSDKIVIIVLSDKIELYLHELPKFKFGKISAWGDGMDFSINCTIKRKEKIKK
jgi:hypothetical protein